MLSSITVENMPHRRETGFIWKRHAASAKLVEFVHASSKRDMPDLGEIFQFQKSHYLFQSEGDMPNPKEACRHASSKTVTPHLIQERHVSPAEDLPHLKKDMPHLRETCLLWKSHVSSRPRDMHYPKETAPFLKDMPLLKELYLISSAGDIPLLKQPHLISSKRDNFFREENIPRSKETCIFQKSKFSSQSREICLIHERGDASSVRATSHFMSLVNEACLFWERHVSFTRDTSHSRKHISSERNTFPLKKPRPISPTEDMPHPKQTCPIRGRHVSFE